MFFQSAPNRLHVNDPAGHGGDLSSYLTYAGQVAVALNLESARLHATKANAAEALGNHVEAIRLWRIIFGDEFPAYG